MLKGDLVTTPLPQVLRQLADSASSGCLHVLDARGEEGRVYLRGGLVYAVQVPGQRPLLGQHLVSSGSLGPEMLAEALEAQRTELQGWKLGELLVHLGYVDAPVVEDFLAEQMRDQAGDLLRWPTGTWKFRVNERCREDVARPTSVEELLADCEDRAAEWDGFLEVLHGPEAVPVLSAAGSTDTELAIDPEAWSLLCKVDGARTLAELALECGFTLFEAGRVVHTLVRSGLLEVEEPVVVEEEASVGASVASRLAAAFAPGEAAPVVIPQQAEEPSPADVAELLSQALREDRTLASPTEEEVDGSIDRISAALSAMLGTTTTDDTLFAPRPRKESKPEPTAAEKEKAERARRRRERDAAELAEAQAQLEAERRAAWEGPFDDDHEAEVVHLEDVRREAARREEEEARAAEQQRLAAEAAALEAEQAALAAERAQLEEAARAAEEDKLRRAEEARLAEAARKAEAERLAEEARQDELRQQEAARLAEEERLRAAEEARLAEARTKLEEEKAALAAERARLEDEVRRAQEEAEAARLAAEAETARLAEEARLAAEALFAQEAEAARLAEEERQAQEAAAEAERVAAEAEAARLAEEAAVEQARLAAEAEAERVAAETEAVRLAEEARLAEQSTAEAERIAAEAQLQQEAAEAEERARIEQQLREEAAAEAAALAAEEAARAAEEQQRLVAEAQAAADAQLAEQARLAAQRTEASSAFAELSAAASIAVVPDPPQAEPEPEPEPAPVQQPAYAGAAPDTDMASLFRELSSLGMEDEPAPVAPVRPPTRPATPPSAQPKKKKGLFGR